MTGLGSQIHGTSLEASAFAGWPCPLEDSTAFHLTALGSAALNSMSLKNKCGPQLIFTQKAHLDILEITKLHS